jgi:hypothetical protein
MVINRPRYDLDSVKEDLKLFFQDNNHQAFNYGSKSTGCNCDSVFYKKQIQVIFENYYPHDVTGKATNELIADNFLKEERIKIGGNKLSISFVYKKQRRYVSAEIKDRIKIVEKFIDDEMNDGCGKQAESLFSHAFEKHQFNIIGRDINSFDGKQWEKSNKDLDFIIEKDGLGYGVEIKNTFDYMPQDEFDEKVAMCQYFGILPLFPVRYASPQQLKIMQDFNGLALIFKTRIFPPGNQKLVTEIWNNFRLPVNVWYDISIPVENMLTSFHSRSLKVDN